MVNESYFSKMLSFTSFLKENGRAKKLVYFMGVANCSSGSLPWTENILGIAECLHIIKLSYRMCYILLGGGAITLHRSKTKALHSLSEKFDTLYSLAGVYFAPIKTGTKAWYIYVQITNQRHDETGTTQLPYQTGTIEIWYLRHYTQVSPDLHRYHQIYTGIRLENYWLL